MDANLYDNSVDYEKLTQSIYQTILREEGFTNVQVKHNEQIRGKSGVKHQIDVYWKFIQAKVEHLVIIECKNYSSNVTLEKIRSFHGVLEDIGNCNGIMVTKTGFQSGVEEYAKHHKIGLKILRKPTDEDWEGKIKDINITLTAKSVVSSRENPPKVDLFLDSTTEEKKNKLDQLQKEGLLNINSGSSSCFYNEKHEAITEQLKYWLPKQLDVLDKEDGGPYTKTVELKDTFILINEETEYEELIPILGVKITYFVESFREEINILGDEVVQFILKDFLTNESEYIKRNDGN